MKSWKWVQVSWGYPAFKVKVHTTPPGGCSRSDWHWAGFCHRWGPCMWQGDAGVSLDPHAGDLHPRPSCVNQENRTSLTVARLEKCLWYMIFPQVGNGLVMGFGRKNADTLSKENKAESKENLLLLGKVSSFLPVSECGLNNSPFILRCSSAWCSFFLFGFTAICSLLLCFL